ncbi:MAG: acetate--CoA ligase [Pseudomonadota bacterium]
MSTIHSMLQEDRYFEPSQETRANSLLKLEDYKKLCEEAAQDYTGYWARLAQEHLSWHTPFTQTLNDHNPPFYRWFEDGQLNVSYNCLDRHVAAGQGNRNALIFEADDGEITRITYQELLILVCKIANGLRSLGLKVGSRVLIYLPMSIEAIACMQACARLGLVHSVVFGGFSAKSVYERIVDSQAKVIITADGQYRGGKSLPLKAAVDEALTLGNTDSISSVIVYRRTGQKITWTPRDRWLHDLIENQPTTCAPVWVHSEHPLFILYTSGSTGTPKGVQHSCAGYLLHALLTMKWVFDIKPEKDMYWCTADVGWITGHTYIAYGPLAAGATQLIFEGIPSYPNAGRFWSMIQNHRVSIFYTAPTAIRSLIKASEIDPKSHPKEFDLSSLRLLGSVGEPINPEAWMWYYNEVGKQRCPILDTWWQTETGGHMISPLAGAHGLKPGSCAWPFPGIDAAIVDEIGEPVEAGTGGLLVIRKPWPSMIRTIWGNPERYAKGYFPLELKGYYLAGDGAQRDSDGYFWIMGRIDDVLNVSGHRLGTMEIESALASNSAVAEAAVVSRPDDITGEAIVAFVVLKQALPSGEEAIEIANTLRNWVGHQIGAIAKPKDIRFGDNLPKTRSGKIMRRLLRALARGETVSQDTSTLENPAILEQLRVTR